MCTPSGGGGMSNPTSPPATSPPETAPPEARTTPTPAPESRGTPEGGTSQQPSPNAGFAPGGGVEYAPQLPPDTNFGPLAVTPPDMPSINTNGQAPPAGGGAAANSPLPGVTCGSIMPPIPLLGWAMDVLGFQTDQLPKSCDSNSAPSDAAAAAALGGSVLLAGAGWKPGPADDRQLRNICHQLAQQYRDAKAREALCRQAAQQAQTDQMTLQAQEPQQAYFLEPGQPGYDAVKAEFAKRDYKAAHDAWKEKMDVLDNMMDEQNGPIGQAMAEEQRLAVSIANTCRQFMKKADAGDGSGYADAGDGDGSAYAAADDTADTGVA